MVDGAVVATSAAVFDVVVVVIPVGGVPKASCLAAAAAAKTAADVHVLFALLGRFCSATILCDSHRHVVFLIGMLNGVQPHRGDNSVRGDVFLYRCCGDFSRLCK